MANTDPPEIDLESEDLDPSLVLFDRQISVKIPVPEARPFNNLDEYYKKTFSKKTESQKQDVQQQQHRDPEIDRLIRQRAMKKNPDSPMEADDVRNQSDLPDVIKKMENPHGPLNLLYISIDKKVKIFIRRRKLASLREERFSWLTGHLVAFDKHFNLVLKNVQETYKYECSKKIIQTIQKKTKQLFIRGDNVILVCTIDPETESSGLHRI